MWNDMIWNNVTCTYLFLPRSHPPNRCHFRLSRFSASMAGKFQILLYWSTWHCCILLPTRRIQSNILDIEQALGSPRHPVYTFDTPDNLTRSGQQIAESSLNHCGKLETKEREDDEMWNRKSRQEPQDFLDRTLQKPFAKSSLSKSIGN